MSREWAEYLGEKSWSFEKKTFEKKTSATKTGKFLLWICRGKSLGALALATIALRRSEAASGTEAVTQGIRRGLIAL